jgi:hypothetical protein
VQKPGKEMAQKPGFFKIMERRANCRPQPPLPPARPEHPASAAADRISVSITAQEQGAGNKMEPFLVYSVFPALAAAALRACKGRALSS